MAMRHWLAVLVAVLLTIAIACGALAYPDWQRNRALEHQVTKRLTADGLTPIPCPAPGLRGRTILLALGQSNAGNHGASGRVFGPDVTVSTNGQRFAAHDPLPGATGRGGSIWHRLAVRMMGPGREQVVVLTFFAVDASPIDDWVRDGSPLRKALFDEISHLRRLNLLPDMILWQHGEADARLGTTTMTYQAQLQRLADLLEQAGVHGPIFLARSTVCRSGANDGVRRAVDNLIASNGRWRSGPDTDQLLANPFRVDGCHFSEEGLDAAAKMWADLIAQRTR